MSQSKHKINKIYVENNEILIFGATLEGQICEKEDPRCAKSFILKISGMQLTYSAVWLLYFVAIDNH